MGTEVIDKISQYVDALAASLGVAATHVYEVMIRQMVAEGIVYGVLLSLLYIVVAIVVLKLAKLTVVKWESLTVKGWDYPVFVGWFVGGSLFTALTITVFSTVPESVMKLCNPEYFIIRDILSVIKGAV
ncbi:hypothetical protein MH117_09855 [Paenibacillus sp. ACRRX]|uniref:hypothetical protein n=1 Tax=Paenibacillus sp. ACRRX TaxID=2918206 RepID=UPI001EF60B60|nr:hypothetical protein [Paenibacillus sp. ACRRX]MCG7407727.1 hypothetical protein [Paenibacillus sp. ACRRX]